MTDGSYDTLLVVLCGTGQPVYLCVSVCARVLSFDGTLLKATSLYIFKG